MFRLHKNRNGGCGSSVAAAARAILLVLCCGGVSYWGFSKGMSVVGDQLRPEVEDNADVKENIGEIDSITMNIMETGKEKQERKDNANWIVFDVTGDKGDGQFIVEMPPGGRDGKPFGKIELRLEDGKIIPIK